MYPGGRRTDSPKLDDINVEIFADDFPFKSDFLVATADQQTIDSNTMMEAFDLFEGVLTDARALFAQRSTEANASLADYVDKHFRSRLHESLPDQKHLFEAILNYFDQSELIENGCASLAELSLAGQ